MRTIAIALLALLVLASVAALASSPSGDRPLTIAEIAARQQKIRADVMDREGPYRDMSQPARNELLDRQSRLLRMLEGKTSTDELTETQRAEAFETMKWIETALRNAEDERMVCELRRQLGSNRKERVCMTVRQQRELREAARDRLETRGVCGDCKMN